jgi:hypothetical protein
VIGVIGEQPHLVHLGALSDAQQLVQRGVVEPIPFAARGNRAELRSSVPRGSVKSTISLT